MKLSLENGIVLHLRGETLEEVIAHGVERAANLNLTGVVVNDELKIVARIGRLPGNVIGVTQIVTENRRIYEAGEAHRAYRWAMKLNSDWTDDEMNHYMDGFEGLPYKGD